MKTTKPNLADLFEGNLIDILLTVDGQGKQAKAAAGVVDSRYSDVRNYSYWTGGVDLGYSFVNDGKNSIGASVGVSYTSSDIKTIKRDIWAYSVGLNASF